MSTQEEGIAAIRPPAPPLLFEEFRTPPPRRQAGRRSKLNLREQRWILLERTEQASVTEIAQQLGVSSSTIYAFMRRVKDDPGVFLDCRYLVPVYGEDRKVIGWLCRYCAHIDAESGWACLHAAEHVFDD